MRAEKNLLKKTTKLPEESEASYKLLVNSIKDYAICMLDPNGIITSWNAGAELIKGYKADEIIGKHFSAFYTAEAVKTHYPEHELAIALKTGKYEEEAWRVKKDGSLFWAHVLITTIFDTNNEFVGFSKITKDLSDKKKLEEEISGNQKALKESEERFRLLIEGVKDYAIFFISPEGIISTWNIGAERIKGYKAEEIIGQSFSKFYTQKAIDEGFPWYELRRSLEDGRFENEGYRIKKNGDTFWANVIITPVFNEKNEHIGFSKITRDLSERKRLEDELVRTNSELRENEEKYRLLVNGVKDYAIFMLSPEGIVLTWNSGAERMKGYAPHEIIGRHFSVFYKKETVDHRFPEYELLKAREEGAFEDEGWRVRKDGSTFWANVVVSPIFDSNKKLLGFSKITRNMTDKIRDEELMKKNKELVKINNDLDNFIYTASHDLKAPVTNLEGLILALLKTLNNKLDAKEETLLKMMETSIIKLKKTIVDLTEITKIQKELESTMEHVSFSGIVEEVKGDINFLITQSGANIIEDFQIQEVEFSRVNLRSIIYNLLTNALKYRDEDRSLIIEISTSRQGEYVCLSVKDNGLGLGKEQQGKLFTMFKRLHTHVEGTGIGLYIIKRIVENRGGRIEVKSELKKGSEFKVYFSQIPGTKDL